jgi:hypothetical protein
MSTTTIGTTGTTGPTTGTGVAGTQPPAGTTTGAPGGPPPGGGAPPPPPPLNLGGSGHVLPKTYLEYYTHRRDLDPPLENVMDAFKSTTRNDPQVAVKAHAELNSDLISTRDSTHHGYVMLASTDKRLIVAHRLSHYRAPLGVANEVWHQKLFALTGDVIGNQMPQTIQWSARSLEILSRDVQVLKLNAQVGALMHADVDTLPPVVNGADVATYDAIRTRHSMYVPGKYLPLLLARRMTPKEALLSLNAEAVSQGEQDVLKPLVDWLRVAVTRTALDDTTTSLVARTLPPILPIMESEFAEKQRVMVERDLPAWNCTNIAPGGSQLPPSQGTGTSNQAQAAILQSLQLLLQQTQTQGVIPPSPARRIKKPSEHWEGTIDLLLRLVGVSAESDLPPLWHAWSNCNKKEARTVLQAHLRDNARALGLPEPVASGDLTTMLNTMAFDSMYEDDLEAGLQPFVVSYKDQQTVANQQRVSKDYDLVQQGAAPQLQDLYALKEASKISVPTTEQQMIRTFKAFAVLLYTVVGPTNPLYMTFKKELVDQYDNFQPLVETYVASLRGQPVHTQMVRWVQLRCNAYWNAVVRTLSGTVRPPDFGGLYNDIQYKQWNRPSIPPKYLAEKAKEKGGGNQGGGSGDGAGRGAPAPASAKQKPPVQEPDRLRNGALGEELRQLGLKVGKVSSFLKKIAPPGKPYAFPPKMGNGSFICMNWHLKGHCWSHCDHIKSHTALSASETTTLTQWLEEGLTRVE